MLTSVKRWKPRQSWLGRLWPFPVVGGPRTENPRVGGSTPSQATTLQQLTGISFGRLVPVLEQARGGVLFLAFLSAPMCALAQTDKPARPTRPSPNITAAMSSEEIRTILAFDHDVVKAAEELGLEPAPSVIYAPRGTRFPFAVDRSKLAFVWPGYNTIVLTDRAIGRKDWQLRCIARHEGLHLRLGHNGGSRTQAEQDEKHREVAEVQRALWDEDSRCE